VSRPARPTGGQWSGAVAAWCALWLVVGVWTGVELWQLGELGGAVAEAGRALGSSGDALQGLSDVPLVGERTGELGAEVQRSSADVVTQAEGARGSLRQLAVLLGLTVSLVPSVPAVLWLVVSGRRGPQSSAG
jgi:hypothetical protein